MENKEWIRKERSLWDAMMSPRRRRHNLHGMPAGPRRNKLKAENEDLAKQEMAAGWSIYGAWVRH